MQKIDRTGEEKYGKYGHMIITKYNNYNDVEVKFDNGYVSKHNSYRTFINGNITNPLYPTVVNKGYYGIGKYVTKINGKHTKEYLVWRTMLVRCYSHTYINKHPTYQKCYVCDEWLNFQNFAEWFHKNYYEIKNEIMDLDKDFMSLNNKVYSPETCIFIPQSLNKTIIYNGVKHSGLPVGVVYANDNHNIFVVKYRENNKDIFVGRFTDKHEAYLKYIEAKNQRLINLIGQYRLYMPTKVYQVLCDFVKNNRIKEIYDAA